MTRRIEVEVEGARARFLLCEEMAPKTVTTFWEALPITAPVRQSKLSGEACSIEFPSETVAALPERPERPEFGVTSIYKGWIVLRPYSSAGMGELLISYGLAEHRRPTGRQQAAPIAELDGDGEALFDALRHTHTQGEKTLVIRQVDGR